MSTENPLTSSHSVVSSTTRRATTSKRPSVQEFYSKGSSSAEILELEKAKRPFYKVYVDDHFPKTVEFIESLFFENAVGVLILFNCITIGMDVQWCPPESSPRSSQDCPVSFMQVAEHGCTAIFVIEFFIRGIFLGFNYHFKSWDRIADVFLVWVTGVLLNWIISPFFSDMEGIRMVTALRAFRLLRVIRVVRFKPQFQKCWMLFQGLAASSNTLVATVAVLLFVNYLFGIWAVTLIGDSPDFGADDKVQSYFIGLDTTLFTMVQIITGDSWASGIARPVMQVMPNMWVFFILYVGVGVFVLLNLITAVIVENAMATSQDDNETRLAELETERRTMVEKLKLMFKEIDTNESDTIEASEFNEILENRPDVVDKFRLLGFHREEIEHLFDDLDNGDGCLAIDEFISSVNNLRGQAKNAELIRVKRSVDRLHKRMDTLFHLLDPGGKKINSPRFQNSMNLSKFKASSRGSKSVLEPKDRPQGSATGKDEQATDVQDFGLKQGSPAIRLNSIQQDEEPEKGNRASDKSGGDPKEEAQTAPRNAANGSPEASQQVALNEVCEEIQRQLKQHLIEVESHVAEIVRSELVQQLEARASYQSTSSGPKQHMGFLSQQHNNELLSLASEHLSVVKIRVAETCRREVARQVGRAKVGHFDTDVDPLNIVLPPDGAVSLPEADESQSKSKLRCLFQDVCSPNEKSQR